MNRKEGGCCAVSLDNMTDLARALAWPALLGLGWAGLF